MPIVKSSDDNSINDNDKSTLHDAGVDVSGLAAPKPDEEKKEALIDMDGSVPESNDEDLKKTGIKFIEEKPVNKEDLSALAEQKSRASQNAKDLEEEFRSELSGTAKTSVVSEKAVVEKISTMAGLLSKISEKLGLKKKKVGAELQNLKKMKEGIQEDIEDIKELEESEEKIKAQLQKMDTIKSEIEAIEKEVGEELKK